MDKRGKNRQGAVAGPCSASPLQQRVRPRARQVAARSRPVSPDTDLAFLMSTGRHCTELNVCVFLKFQWVHFWQDSHGSDTVFSGPPARTPGWRLVPLLMVPHGGIVRFPHCKATLAPLELISIVWGGL